VFHESYLQINWHTKNNIPLIIPDLEPAIYAFLRKRCQQTKGVYLHGIGGTSDHVHLAVNIEPFVKISDLVGDLKGACSYEINQQSRMKALEWQRGFGVVSFGQKQLPWVLAYIANQKEHHSTGRIYDRLERTEFDEQAG
jgi:REP-associated tyrosine transposase